MIRLVATGGTIATIAGPSGRIVGKTGNDLVNEARRVWPLPDVHVIDTEAMVSFALTRDDLGQILKLCGNDSPIVITHGTDAMEETAIALALTRDASLPPIVLTGAQRPFDDPSPDGPRNLAAAIKWANSPEANGSGVSVVFADNVYPGIGVKKTHTVALNGFSCPGRGPTGVVDEAGVRLLSVAQAPFPLATDIPDVSSIHVLPTYLEGGTAMVDFLGMHSAGIVVEGMGSGNTPPRITAALTELIKRGTPVVITSRTGAGATAALYSRGGSDLERAGAVFAGDLSTIQTRWALAAALSHGSNWNNELIRWLQAAGCVSRQD